MFNLCRRKVWVTFSYIKCQLDLSTASFISSVLFCLALLILSKQYLIFGKTRYYQMSVTASLHLPLTFWLLCPLLLCVPGQPACVPGGFLGALMFLQPCDLVRRQDKAYRAASTRLPFDGLFRFCTCSFCSCSMLDFSFDCSEDFDINAFEDIISFYENKK